MLGTAIRGFWGWCVQISVGFQLVKLPWNQATHRRMYAGLGLGSAGFNDSSCFLSFHCHQLIIIGIDTVVLLLSIFHQYAS
jgi:hypothetical protein